MRANGAGKAVAIRRCISKIIFIFVGDIISIRREHERRSAGPTSDKLSTKAFACDRITLAKSAVRGRVEESPEASHVLCQLTEDEITTVEAQITQILRHTLISKP